ncbi:hypothetical protein EBS_1432 [endosymbiont of unidentified scaly snail isolate Monju]|nr:hypothetical protein EBS_1432 [endosymbiont of unidentified scaly snail isolate Monju]
MMRRPGLLLLLMVLWLGETYAIDGALDDGRLALELGDYARARALLEPLQARGVPRAAFYLSLIYQKGLGVEADPERAHRLLRQAADAGDPLAQYNLGNEYLREGTEAGTARAAALWRQAAEQGLVLAQHNLGSLYALGKGVERDLEQARYWYRMAQRNGSTRSAEALAALDKLQDETGEGQDAGTIVVNAAWLEARRDKEFTLQLMATRDRAVLQELVGFRSWQRPLLRYRIRAGDGQVLWALGYGIFADAKQAVRARLELPPSLRRNDPWPRSLAGIRERLAE